ncbi:MAG TPA: T9SS type A sorting domain-containing protein [Bacteroidia bacterium]|jgi:hypothetical protein|nr:T9SS type A sorting domain-containing protein [Bacteroidia bacterium]
MKKSILAILLLIFSFSSSFGQTWSAVGGGINKDVFALCVYNGNLFAAGIFDSAGGKPANSIAEWNGTAWSTLGTGINGSVYALCVYNGNLCAGGLFDTAGGVAVNNIAVWNGTNWSALGKGTDSTVNAIKEYNGDLYAGGDFDSAGGILVNYIAVWNGSNWGSLGTGTNSDVNTLLVEYNGTLCVGGGFTIAGGSSANYISTWNGTSWNSIGGGITAPTYAVCEYNDSLYAGEDHPYCLCNYNTANYLQEWNGTSWFSSGFSGSYGGDASFKGFNSFAVYDSTLYVGGALTPHGGPSWFGIPILVLSSWSGTSWVSEIGNLNSGDVAFSLCVYNGNLYAGGLLYIGSVRTNIVELTLPTGINDIKPNNSINSYPNPSNGKFTIQSSVVNVQSIVEIYNVLGEKIYSQYSLPNTQYQIDLSKEPSGIYFYRVTTEKGELIGNGKLIIQ